MLRWIRHVLPQCLVHFFLQKKFLIGGSGAETNYPDIIVDKYEARLNVPGYSLKGKKILVFGFGGYLGFAVELLKRGAEHVYLYDKYAPLDDSKNAALYLKDNSYLVDENKKIRPDSKYITMIKCDFDEYAAVNIGSIDCVMSNSVLEHVDNVDETVDLFKKTMSEDGVNIHFIDLRDHFFKYPFHMLCFSEKIWKKYLNPGSNLNRYRTYDYRKIFNKYFDEVKIEAVSSNLEAFIKLKKKIKPEFIVGDNTEDSITKICVMATNSINN